MHLNDKVVVMKRFVQKYVQAVVLLSIVTHTTFSIFYKEPNEHNISHSFMFTRPAFANLAMQNQLWNEIIFNKKGDLLGAFQIIGYTEKSLHIAKTNKYFLFHNKENLLFSGDANTEQLRTRDVRAEWFGLPSTFQGIFGVQPTQKQTGFQIEYNQDLKNLIDLPFVKNWRFGISLPIVIVENHLQMHQTTLSNPTTQDFPNTIFQAVNQPSWRYDKMRQKASKTGLAQIRLSLASAYLSQNHHLISYYSALILPTGPAHDSEYLFNPTVGYDRHAGIEGGVNLQIMLNKDSDLCAACFFVNLNSIYLIHNSQHRTFDLLGKRWSRFLLFNRKDGGPNQNIPGVNVLTREATVRPYGIFDFSTGWKFEHQRFSFEIGYNIWGHSREQINELTKPFPEDLYGIAAVQSPTDILPATASTSTISTLGPTDMINNVPLFIPISEFDLDLASGCAAAALNHRVDLALGIKNIGVKNDCFFGAGAFFEIPQKNGALETYGFWIKVGASI